jgi:hypothetical protein
LAPLPTTSALPKQLLLDRIHQHLERNRREFRQRHHLN